MNESEVKVYRDLLYEIKSRVRPAQLNAAVSVNAGMILMYWDIGRMIADRQLRQGWGAKVVPRLSSDLKSDLLEEKGFSGRNIKRMLRFFREYPELRPPVSRFMPPPVTLL